MLKIRHDADLRRRYQIVLHSAEGVGRRRIAQMLQCSPTTVSRVQRRFLGAGEAGLIDRREDNGHPKVTEDYVAVLIELVAGSPRDCGRSRPTWTQPLLVDVLAEQTGIRISVSTMSVLLRSLGIRRGWPKPTVQCPWSKARKAACLRRIRRLIERAGPNEVVVWEDEADIDLNPRIGPDYMLPGQQKQVSTPGQNVKRYVAAALDAHHDRLVWVTGARKHSGLFIDLLRALLRRYGGRRVIHVILDNFRIHKSRQTEAFLRSRPGRIRLHFLPPYCPDDNRIERSLWREIHANVTRNHQCETIEALMGEVEQELRRRDRHAAYRAPRHAA
jgi:transposase